MKVLCNLPLECFDSRATFADVELLTFGPAGRMVVDGTMDAAGISTSWVVGRGDGATEPLLDSISRSASTARRKRAR